MVNVGATCKSVVGTASAPSRSKLRLVGATTVPWCHHHRGHLPLGCPSHEVLKRHRGIREQPLLLPRAQKPQAVPIPLPICFWGSDFRSFSLAGETGRHFGFASEGQAMLCPPGGGWAKLPPWCPQDPAAMLSPARGWRNGAGTHAAAWILLNPCLCLVCPLFSTLYAGLVPGWGWLQAGHGGPMGCFVLEGLCCP